MIRAVLFDYGGVLCANGRANGVRQALAAIFGIDEVDVQVDDLHNALRAGTISSVDFFAELNRRHRGAAQADEALFHQGTGILEPAKEVYALAEALRVHGIKTGILSNIYKMTADLLRHNGCYDGFDPVVLSCDEHLVKPEPQFYELAVRRLGVPATEVLFIDDQERCLPPARELGMRVILAHNPGQIVADTMQLFKTENHLDLAV